MYEIGAELLHLVHEMSFVPSFAQLKPQWYGEANVSSPS